MPIEGSDPKFAIVGRGTVFDGIAYWLILAGVYLMVGGLMFYSGKEKLFDSDGDAPRGSSSSSRTPSCRRSRNGYGLVHPRPPRVRGVRSPAGERRPPRVPASPRQVDPAGRAWGSRCSRSRAWHSGRPATQQILRHCGALHLLRVDGGDPATRQRHAAEQARQLAERRAPHRLRAVLTPAIEAADAEHEDPPRPRAQLSVEDYRAGATWKRESVDSASAELGAPGVFGKGWIADAIRVLRVVMRAR